MMKRQVGILLLLGVFGCNDAGNPRDSGGDVDSAGLPSADTDDTTAPTDDDADSDDSESATAGPTDDDSDGESTGGPGDDETGDPAGCDQEQFSFVVEAHPPNVMLVLDKSRSMTSLWNHDDDVSTPDVSRWNSLHNVVTGLLAEFGDDFNFGAQLFPAADAWLDEPDNDWSCRVEADPEVAAGANTSAAILAAMPAAGDANISGGTPAVAGLQSALDHLSGVDGDGSKAIVFVTDGAANCSPSEAPEDTLFVYDDEVPDVISDAFANQSIPVYVVGIDIVSEMGTKPAVNPDEAITDAANVGGAPAAGPRPYYNAVNELQLGDALDDVLTDIECTINLEVEPAFPSSVAVTVDLHSYAPVGDCDTEDGWVFTDPDGPFNAIQLCGAACGLLQNGGLVEVDYICPG